MKMLGPGDSQGSRRTGEGNRIYLKVKGRVNLKALKGLQESFWIIEN